MGNYKAWVGSLESELGATFMFYESCTAKVSLTPKDNGNILWHHQLQTTNHQL